MCRGRLWQVGTVEWTYTSVGVELDRLLRLDGGRARQNILDLVHICCCL